MDAPTRSFVLVLAAVSTLIGTSPAAGEAQHQIVMDGELATVLADIEGAQLLQAEGPKFNPNNRTDNLHYQWFMVQDSALGVVFTEPSGVRWNTGRSAYDGDIDLQALQNVSAVELRAITLDVWRELGPTLSITNAQTRLAGETFNFDPTWGRWVMHPSAYMISVLFVSRVLMPDGSIVEAPEDRVLAVARALTEAITLDDLVPDTPPPGIPGPGG